ncbi:MAG: Crp/Fnr family transcriptional regulator [Rhizobiaceae bacterium]|nr:Crp/Fnr family transcriptional regulator [Rhizobiaceae bacterium]
MLQRNPIMLEEHNDNPSAIYLSEYLMGLNEGSTFLSNLTDDDLATVRRLGTKVTVQKGQNLFFQGDKHNGVWIVESGRMRSYYTGPSGREITLAYWTPGHFVGGPEVFGGGLHIWSGDAMEETELLFLSGTTMKRLVREIPDIAIAVIDGLVYKGKCYSALIQMLGTRSVSERLEQLLVILASAQGIHENNEIIIERSITFEQIATIVGATRQWVTQSFEKLQKRGIVTVNRKNIRIKNIDSLSGMF